MCRYGFFCFKIFYVSYTIPGPKADKAIGVLAIIDNIESLSKAI